VSFRDISESTLDVPITPEKNLFMCDACASVCQKVQNCKTGTISAVNELQSKKIPIVGIYFSINNLNKKKFVC
jgi:hypothetical protein